MVNTVSRNLDEMQLQMFTYQVFFLLLQPLSILLTLHLLHLKLLSQQSGTSFSLRQTTLQYTNIHLTKLLVKV